MNAWGRAVMRFDEQRNHRTDAIVREAVRVAV